MRMLIVVLAGAVSLTGCVSVSPPTVRAPDDALVYQPAAFPEGEWSPPGLDFEDDVAAEHVRYLPVRYLMRNRFDSLSKIDQYEGPLLMAHGDADELIPLEQAQQLLEAAPGPKKLLTIPDADHNWAPTEEFIDEIDRFLDQVAGRESATDPRPRIQDEL